MKKLIIAIAVMSAVVMPVTAASPRVADLDDLAQKQARLFANQIGLDDATAEKFVKLYVQNQRDNCALQSKAPSDKKQDLKTDAQIDSSIRAQFDYSQKLLDVRKKYYKEYRKLLTAKQVKKLYEREKLMNSKIRRINRGTHRKAAAETRKKAAVKRRKADNDRRKAAGKRVTDSAPDVQI